MVNAGKKKKTLTPFGKIIRLELTTGQIAQLEEHRKPGEVFFVGAIYQAFDMGKSTTRLELITTTFARGNKAIRAAQGFKLTGPYGVAVAEKI